MIFGASQDPGELHVVLEEIEALDPLRVIVEIGCDQGGTLYAWRSVCERVYGITLADNEYDAGGSGKPLLAHGATVRVGDSHDPASLEWLTDELGVLRLPEGEYTTDPVDVLVLDGDHTAAGVVADLVMYGPLVRPGGMILLHDINSGADPRVHVPEVWHALRSQHEASEITAEDGGPGWGIIHVREGDRFSEEQAHVQG